MSKFYFLFALLVLGRKKEKWLSGDWETGKLESGNWMDAEVELEEVYASWVES
jgi:hypothetical protein